MQYLKADTETIIAIGPFVDVGDGFTPQIDIDISETNEAELIKHGTGTVTNIAANTWAAVTDCRGWYKLTLSAGNLDTEGQIDIVIQDDSDCLPVHKQFQVVNTNVYDSLFAAASTDVLDVNVKEVSDDETAADNLELFTEVLETGTGLIDSGTFKAGAITAAAIADAAIDNATFAADVGSTAYATNIIALAVRKVLDELNLDHLLKISTGVIADGDLSDYVVDQTVISHVMAKGADTSDFKASTDSLEAIKDHADTIKTETASIQVETTALDTLTKAAGDGDLAAILVDTSEIGGAVGESISADLAEVKAETALIVEDTGTTLPARFTGVEGATFATGTDSLEAIRNHATTIKTETASIQVETTALDTLTKASGDGDLAAILVDTAEIGAAGAGLTDLGGMSTSMKAEVNAECDTALSDYGGPTKGEMDTAHGLLATESKQDIIDTNVDTIITTGSTGPWTTGGAGGGDATEAKQDTIIATLGTVPALDGAAQTVGAAIGKLADDNGGADFDATTDSQEKIKNAVDAISITGGGTPQIK